MTNRLRGALVSGLAALSFALPARAADPVIRVDAAHVTNTITPWMTGSCIEDVNHEIYGGLYDQKIFGESFEEPPAPPRFAGWTACGGSWRADGTGCRVDAEAGAKLVWDAAGFVDGAVDVDVKTPAGSGNAGLLVRVRNAGIGADEFDGYEISIGADGRRVILGKHRHDFRPLASALAAAAPGRWHHLRVVMAGARIQVFLDGAADPALDYTDTDSPLPSGRVALRNWLTDASFRNVRIQTGQGTANAPLLAEAGESVSGMWDAIRTGDAKASFLCDPGDPFNGGCSQMIRHDGGTGRAGVANRGLNRWGIAVAKGQRFAGRIFLRARALQGPVTVALQSADGSVTYASRTLPAITNVWRKYAFSLKSRAADPNARFAVWIDRPGTLWADQAVLMGTGSEQFHGLPVRADIANALVDEGVTFLRYAGTMVNAPEYRWKKMIGDPDRRPPYEGHWYRHSTNGFGIFDFLNFCEAAHFGAAFAINIEETDQDAADLADYLTAPVSNPWGRKRAEDGHPAPYRVQYLEIGNEECLGGDVPSDYRHYSDRFQAIARAIHSRNPDLKLVSAAWWRPESPSMETVFKAIDGEAAAWDAHVGGDDPRSGDDVDREMTEMQRKFRQWNPNTAMKAVIFEENGGRHDMQRALGHATTLNATRRHGDFVLVDCPANCLQPWRQNDNGWDQGQIFFTADRVWAMPPFYAQQMAAKTYEPLCVQSAVSGSGDLSVVATRSADGKTLVLSVVNTGSAPQAANITLAGFDGAKEPAEAWTLAGDPQAVNPPDGPEVIHPRRDGFEVRGSSFPRTFPAHSYVIVRLRR
jgi:alpha-L-arabinofuranosidase